VEDMLPGTQQFNSLSDRCMQIWRYLHLMPTLHTMHRLQVP
jgi:hypothetical protein